MKYSTMTAPLVSNDRCWQQRLI